MMRAVPRAMTRAAVQFRAQPSDSPPYSSFCKIPLDPTANVGTRSPV
jgi:hypothetical protein